MAGGSAPASGQRTAGGRSCRRGPPTPPRPHPRSTSTAPGRPGPPLVVLVAEDQALIG